MTEPDRVFFEAYWAKTDVHGKDECWPWTPEPKGKRLPHPTIQREGRQRQASQIGWEILHQQRFPEGMFACHTCDNPRCVNPHHIFVGTQKDNVRDAVRKKRMRGQRKTHCIRGHELAGPNLTERPNGRRGCKACNTWHQRRYRRLRKEAT